jgi:hypothetical protein
MSSDERGSDCALCQRPVDWPVVRESEFWLTVVNRNQNLLGKTFIALCRHEEDIVALTPGEWVDDPDYPDSYRPAHDDELATKTVIDAVADALRV